MWFHRLMGRSARATGCATSWPPARMRIWTPPSGGRLTRPPPQSRSQTRRRSQMCRFCRSMRPWATVPPAPRTGSAPAPSVSTASAATASAMGTARRARRVPAPSHPSPGRNVAVPGSALASARSRTARTVPSPTTRHSVRHRAAPSACDQTRRSVMARAAVRLRARPTAREPYVWRTEATARPVPTTVRP